MATPFLVGIGAIAAGLAGRHFLRRSARGAADQWVKGGFKAKMDRKEALAILGLKYASIDCKPRRFLVWLIIFFFTGMAPRLSRN
jgi:hypothetical protein